MQVSANKPPKIAQNTQEAATFITPADAFEKCMERHSIWMCSSCPVACPVTVDQFGYW